MGTRSFLSVKRNISDGLENISGPSFRSLAIRFSKSIGLSRPTCLTRGIQPNIREWNIAGR